MDIWYIDFREKLRKAPH